MGSLVRTGREVGAAASWAGSWIKGRVHSRHFARFCPLGDRGQLIFMKQRAPGRVRAIELVGYS